MATRLLLMRCSFIFIPNGWEWDGNCVLWCCEIGRLSLIMMWRCFTNPLITHTQTLLTNNNTPVGIFTLSLAVSLSHLYKWQMIQGLLMSRPAPNIKMQLCIIVFISKTTLYTKLKYTLKQDIFRIQSAEWKSALPSWNPKFFHV